MKKIPLVILSAVILFLFFSYKLTSIPPGLTIDEAAFGYNANLISQTLHDENGRFFPVFVLSINGKDWRQPVTQYLDVVYFKIFTASIYNLRVTSVLIIVISTLLIYFLGQLIIDRVYAVLVSVFFITTPIIMIHSHLGLDNIAPLPFTILWLVFLVLYRKNGNTRLLIYSAISLGIGFYSYKGMRSFTTIWSILTVIYLSLPYLKSMNKKKFLEIIKPVLTFSVSILPFYLAIPFLEYKYAGAVLGQTNARNVTVYQFFKSYLSSFDPSFLFITGDELPHHSTMKHGMLLLASLPFSMTGLIKVKKQGKLFVFILLSLFLGPILFGFPGSYHRASRLIAVIPLYSLIAGLGGYHLLKNKGLQKILFIFFAGLVVINYTDFLNYYWNSYSNDYDHIFYKYSAGEAYKYLKEESEKNGLSPVIDLGISDYEKTDDGYPNKFLRSIYFLEFPEIWKEGELLPDNSLLMTNNRDLEGFKKVDFEVSNYYFFVK